MKEDFWLSLSKNLFKYGFIVGGFYLIFTVNSLNKWNNLIIEISIGLLTFISIFYAFILRKDVRIKIASFLIERWKEKIQPFINTFQEIVNKIKTEGDYKGLLFNSKKLYHIIESIVMLESELDIDKNLYASSISFVVAIILFFMDSVLNLSYTYGGITFTIRFFGFIFFWYACYYVIELLRKWSVIALKI